MVVLYDEPDLPILGLSEVLSVLCFILISNYLNECYIDQRTIIKYYREGIAYLKNP